MSDRVIMLATAVFAVLIVVAVSYSILTRRRRQ